MNTIIYKDVNKLAMEDAPLPVPESGEGLIKVATAGICGSDISILSGKHPRAKAPLILGHEFCGELVEIKSNTKTQLQQGDTVTVFPLIACHSCFSCKSGNEHVCSKLRVIGIDRDGGMAEYARVPLDNIVTINPDTDPVMGVLTEPLAVAVRSVRESGVGVGDTVFILGGGTIGILIALVLRYAGIHKIVISEPNKYRIDKLTQMGFEVVDPTEKDITTFVSDYSQGAGVDILFEASGAQAAAEMMTECIRPKGKIILVSVFKEPARVDLRSINFKEAVMLGIRGFTRFDFARAVELINDNNIDLVSIVTHVLPVTEAEKGFSLIQKQQDALKIIIKF